MTRLEEQFMNRVPTHLKNIEECLDARTIAAIMFGQALISGKSYFSSADILAKTAVEYADALINKLNK